MELLDSFGGLVSGIIASIVMLVFAILSFFITVFIVNQSRPRSTDTVSYEGFRYRPQDYARSNR